MESPGWHQQQLRKESIVLRVGAQPEAPVAVELVEGQQLDLEVAEGGARAFEILMCDGAVTINTPLIPAGQVYHW